MITGPPDPTKGGLSNGNVAEVDLEKKAKEHLVKCKVLLLCVWQRPEMMFRRSLKDIILTRTQSAVSHTHHIPDLKICHFYD